MYINFEYTQINEIALLRQCMQHLYNFRGNDTKKRHSPLKKTINCQLSIINCALCIVHCALYIVHCALCIVHCALLTDHHIYSLDEFLRFHHQLVHVAVVLDKGHGLTETGDKFLDEG